MNFVEQSGFIPRDQTSFTGRIDPKGFAAIMPLIGPDVTRGAYLFAMNKEGYETYFTIEGQVTEFL